MALLDSRLRDKECLVHWPGSYELSIRTHMPLTCDGWFVGCMFLALLSSYGWLIT